MIIIFALFLFIIGIMLNALILDLLVKKFKVQSTAYSTALKISFFEWLTLGLIGVIIGFVLSGISGNVIAWILAFIVFNFLCKKYYLTQFKKNLSIYLLLNLIIIVISLAVILPIRFFIAEPFYVEGDAMSPTFPDKTYIIVNKFSKSLQRGDVIILKSPQDNNQYMVKRIIALPNEKVQIKDGFVYIFNSENQNGLKLEEPYILNGAQVFTVDNSQIILNQGQYYVLGDNPSVSKDSRSFGAVTGNLIVGKYWFTPRLTN